MTTNYPNEDPTVQLPAGTPVNTPASTTAWRARTVVEDVYRLLDQIAAHPRPQPSVQAWADMIREQADELTTGQKLAATAIPTLEEARENLALLVKQLTSPASVIVIGPGESTVDDGWRLPQVIRAERQRLPQVSRWPWRDADARRQVKTWTRAWRRLLAYPIDRAAVARAWQAYLDITNRPVQAQITDRSSPS